MPANEIIERYSSQQVMTKMTDMPAKTIDDHHFHPWHQIVFPLTGLLQSEIATKSIIVPHNGMLYIPANTTHKSVAVTDTQFFAIYLNPEHSVSYSKRAKSCAVTPLTKQMLLQLLSSDLERYTEQMETNLLSVLRDQISLSETYEIPLLIPTDRRLNAIFEQLQRYPDLSLTLPEWANKVGASERTLSRVCAKEFNQSFSLWRQNVRLVLSLQMLEAQDSIQNIAIELGYTSDSAYIQAFKRVFGQTPNRYRDQQPVHSFGQQTLLK
ncbi:AraC family transcriptional regulator [uncultured Vibrio sp.]|uniref:AraC family transcriptional regulator n=1 Tax=uncultured Vibrio sp. TaxID=114054 RepID=UPI0025F3F086|nr:AraC family transcriptional regulator [uncultured Vibrio sp.]